MIADLDQLDTLLGEHHDLYALESAVMKAGPAGAAAARRVLSGAATARQDAVWQEASTLGGRVLADTPRAFAHAVREALAT